MEEQDPNLSGTYRYLRIALGTVIIAGLLGALVKYIVTGQSIDAQIVFLATALATVLFGAEFVGKFKP